MDDLGCPRCGAPIDVFMTQCSSCRAALQSGLGVSDPTWGAGNAGVAVIPPDAPPLTRDGNPISTRLAWVIALLPAVLLALSLLVGLWPSFIAIVVHIIIVTTVVAWDSRRLDRELVDVSWFWVFLTPATYLFARAAAIGRGSAAAWGGAATTATWFVALFVGDDYTTQYEKAATAASSVMIAAITFDRSGAREAARDLTRALRSAAGQTTALLTAWTTYSLASEG